jgi:hypothetical protein
MSTVAGITALNSEGESIPQEFTIETAFNEASSDIDKERTTFNNMRENALNA